MAQLELPPGLLPSLKDRLIDPDSMGTRDRPGLSLADYVDSVRNDIEELLNTRRSHSALKKHYAELAKSMIVYGLPDLTSMKSSTAGQQELIGKIIETTITLHEPRLRNVRATLVQGRAVDLRVRFLIDAKLRVDPAPSVAFETEVELTTGHASIRERT